MKTRIVATVLTIVATLLIVDTTSAQQRNIVRSYGRATTSWTKLGRPNSTIALYNPSFANDTTAGSDTLWIAVNRDTTNKVPLYAHESLSWPIQCDTLLLRASGSNAIPYRMWADW